MRPVYAGVRAQLPINLDQGLGLGCELRADHAGAPLRVKPGPVLWVLADAASRLQHRAAAWDQVRAALAADITRSLCARDGGRLLAQAWQGAGLPARGQPLTARHVHGASRLVDLLDEMEEPPCDGTQQRYAQAGRQLALAVALRSYERIHGDPEDDWGLGTPAGQLAQAAWALLKDDPHLSVSRALGLARLAQSQIAAERAAPAAAAEPASHRSAI